MFLGLSTLHICKPQVPGAPPFSPSSVAALTGWMDPSNNASLAASSVSGGTVTNNGACGQDQSQSPATVLFTTTDANRFIWTQDASGAYFSGGNIGWTTNGGGGSTTAFFIACAVNINTGFVAYQYSDYASGTPNVGYDLRYDGNTNTMIFTAGNGTARTACSAGGTLPVIPTGSFVCIAWDDGVNLNCQVNNNAVGTVARPVVSAGAANAFAGSQSGLNPNAMFANNYGLIWAKNNALTSQQRANIKTWLGQKVGLSL